MLFVCENNQYAVSTSVGYSVKTAHIADRAAGYGMKGKTIDGNNAPLVYREAQKAARYVRENGPMLLECITYRYMGHSKSDANVYRTRSEIDEWKKKDPLVFMRNYMLEHEFTQQETEKLEADCAKAIEGAVDFAEASGEPDLSEIMDYIYA